jgi:hypothetical protein
VWALVTGILAIVCCGPIGIAAIILGKGAQRDIEASGGALTGGGMAKAGYILGIIGLVLTVLGFLLFTLGFVEFPTSTPTTTK